MSKNTKLGLIALIALFGFLPQVATDIYIPSIPAMAGALSTSINDAQWTLPAYVFGMFASMMPFGIYSEAHGRKRPIIWGLILMIVGTFIATVAPNIETLIAGRLVQGIGAGSCASLWRAVFRDSFSGPELSTYGGYLSSMVTFILPAAPVLGGYLQESYGWRASFIFMLAYTIATLFIVIFTLNETHTSISKSKITKQFIKGAFKEMLTSNDFMGYALCASLAYGTFFAWFTVGPVLIIKILGISPSTFGWIVFVGAASIFGTATRINRILNTKYGHAFCLKLGFSLIAFSGVLMLVWKGFSGLTPLNILIPTGIMMFGTAFIWPNTFAGAFKDFGHIAGYAGSFYSCIQTGGAALMGAIIAYLPDTNQVPLAMSYIIPPVICLMLVQFVVSKKGE